MCELPRSLLSFPIGRDVPLRHTLRVERLRHLPCPIYQTPPGRARVFVLPPLLVPSRAVTCAGIPVGTGLKPLPRAETPLHQAQRADREPVAAQLPEAGPAFLCRLLIHQDPAMQHAYLGGRQNLGQLDRREVVHGNVNAPARLLDGPQEAVAHVTVGREINAGSGVWILSRSRATAPAKKGNAFCGGTHCGY